LTGAKALGSATTFGAAEGCFAPKDNVPYEIIYPSNGGYSIVELIERPKDDVAKLNVWVVEGSTTIKASEYVKRRAGFPPVTPL